MASTPSTAHWHWPGEASDRPLGWPEATAVLFIGLGLVAIVEPLVAGLTAALLAGWLFVFAGMAHAVGAFRAEGLRRVFWQAVLSVIYLAAGVALLARPFMGLATLTLFLASILVAEAVLNVIVFFQITGEKGAGLLLFKAAVTALLAGLIWTQWPSSSTWAIGTLIGVNLLFNGVSRLVTRPAY